MTTEWRKPRMAKGPKWHILLQQRPGTKGKTIFRCKVWNHAANGQATIHGIGWRETKIRKPLHLIGKTLGSCRFSCQRIPVNIETRRNISNQIDDTSKSMKQVFWYNEMFASACMLNTTNNNELNKSIAKSSRELVWNSEHLPTNRNICELPEHLSAHLKHIKQQASSIIINHHHQLVLPKMDCHIWSRIWGHRWMRDIMWVPSILCFVLAARHKAKGSRSEHNSGNAFQCLMAADLCGQKGQNSKLPQSGIVYSKTKNGTY